MCAYTIFVNFFFIFFLCFIIKFYSEKSIFLYFIKKEYLFFLFYNKRKKKHLIKLNYLIKIINHNRFIYYFIIIIY